MAKKRKYKKYEAWVRAAISMTARPDLFPELKIPLTTAKYWIKKRYSSDDPLLEALSNAINLTKQELKESKQSTEENETLRILIKDIFIAFGFSLRWKHIESKETKTTILEAIERALPIISREACLEALDLSLSRYKRWRRERRGCGISELKTCPRSQGNQLTFKEVQTMKRLVTSTEFSFSHKVPALFRQTRKASILFVLYLA